MSIHECLSELRAWIEGHRVGANGFDCVQARDVAQIVDRFEAEAARVRTEFGSIPILTAARVAALEKQLDQAFQLRDWDLVGYLQDEIAALTPNTSMPQYATKEN